MLKVLSIGNSFSQDAHAYLHTMSECDGPGINTKINTVNLYIGGCSLKTHWENAQSGEKCYQREENGVGGGETVSLSEGLSSEAWDIVTFQQASHDSGLPETYFPYLRLLLDYAGARAPQAAKMLHETWAYETDSAHEMFYRYGRDQQAMYLALKAAYGEASARLGLPLIPCGDVIQALRGEKPFDYENGGVSLCRDGFHLSCVYGRYAAAATWYETLAGGLSANGFLPPEADPALVELIKRAVVRTCATETKNSKTSTAKNT
ncbi:MAG: DUF4886 domain-containing protein [Defluviitaleaceae bacterium]|nr:DUF4886 domain-containing protein [Defluviitaleaceae bacterium]